MATQEIQVIQIIKEIGTFLKLWTTIWVQVKRALDSVMPQDPLTLKKRHYDNNMPKLEALRAEIEQLEKKEGNTSRLDELQRVRESARRLGSQHYHKARVLWGRLGRRTELACAWSYVFAAECYKLAKVPEFAAHLFHWAAHQFRNAGDLGAAWDHYLRSAELVGESDPLRARSLKRARGVGQSIGESLPAKNATELGEAT